jgi:hypothetical protein
METNLLINDYSYESRSGASEKKQAELVINSKTSEKVYFLEERV